MEGIHYANKHYNDNPAFILGTEGGRTKALRDFRMQREAENSEFAAEFARLKQGGYKPAFGMLETVGLTPLLVGCEQAVRESALELLWIDCPGGSWAAACLQGEPDELERGLAAGLAAAKRFDDAAIYHVFREASPALTRWFRLGKLSRATEKEDGYMQTDTENSVERLKRKVDLQNTANLLEYTDTELRELIRQNLSNPEQLTLSQLNSMHKEELVDYYNRMQHGHLN